MKTVVCNFLILLGAAQLISACTIIKPIKRVLRIQSFVSEEVEMTCLPLQDSLRQEKRTIVPANGNATIEKADRSHGFDVQSLPMDCAAAIRDRYLVCKNLDYIGGAKTVAEMPVAYEVRALGDQCSAGFKAYSGLYPAKEEPDYFSATASGVWESECVPQLKSKGSIMVTVDLTSPDFSLRQTLYADQHCQDETQVVVAGGQASVGLVDKITANHPLLWVGANTKVGSSQLHPQDLEIKFAIKAVRSELGSEESVAEGNAISETPEIAAATLLVPGDPLERAGDTVVAFYSDNNSPEEETMRLIIGSSVSRVAAQLDLKRAD